MTGPQTGTQAGMTGQQTGQAGTQAGQTGPLTGPAAVVSPAPTVLTTDAVSVPVSSRFGVVVRKEDVYHDYLHIVTGSHFDASTIKWRLVSSATPVEFQLWESHIDSGFERCKAFDTTFGGQTEFIIAYRRVDDVLAR
jgi:hypothetical protein